jgi:ammonia channel protein AmtB
MATEMMFICMCMYVYVCVQCVLCMFLLAPIVLSIGMLSKHNNNELYVEPFCALGIMVCAWLCLSAYPFTMQAGHRIGCLGCLGRKQPSPQRNNRTVNKYVKIHKNY